MQINPFLISIRAKSFWLIILACHILYSSHSQFEFPSLSPKGQLSQMVGNTFIEIEYERPSVRGRKIFGELVPWKKVWRTGAGFCTKISFNRDVTVGNQMVSAGEYALFTIPNPKEWIVILNSDTSLYGSYDYDPSKDIARFQVKAKKSHRFYETLTLDLDIIPNNARLYLNWENTQISFDMITSTDKDVLEYINNNLVNYLSKDSEEYAGGSDYLLYQHQNLYDAIKIAQHAIKLDAGNAWARRVEFEAYEKLRLYEQSILAGEQAIQYLNEVFKDDPNELKIRVIEWEKSIKRVETKMK